MSGSCVPVIVPVVFMTLGRALWSASVQLKSRSAAQCVSTLSTGAVIITHQKLLWQVCSLQFPQKNEVLLSFSNHSAAAMTLQDGSSVTDSPGISTCGDYLNRLSVYGGRGAVVLSRPAKVHRIIPQ